MKRRLILASSGALLVAGCTPASVHSWRIAAMPGPVQGGHNTKISVRTIGLPSALNQPGVPEPGPANTANSFINDLWAAPLAAMLQISMVENLAQRLPGDMILADGGAIGATPDEFVEIQILAFSPDAAGTITLQAQLAIRPFNSQNWTMTNFKTSAPGGLTAGTITACMSQLWGQAADQLATMLR